MSVCLATITTTQYKTRHASKQAKRATQPRLPVSPSSALRTWICCCYRAACSALPACTECGSKKRSAVFGTSVTEPRSPLDSILYTLFTFDFQSRERTNGPTNNNRPRQSIPTTQHNPTQTPTSTNIVQPLRALSPSSPPTTSPRQHREPINPRLSHPLKILTRNITHSSLTSPTSLAGPDRACLLRKDLLQLPCGWMFAVRGIEGGVVWCLLGLVRFGCAFGFSRQYLHIYGVVLDN